MFNYNNPETIRLLIEGVPAAESLILDAKFKRLMPEHIDEILKIVGVATLDEAMRIVYETRHLLATRVETSVSK